MEYVQQTSLLVRQGVFLLRPAPLSEELIFQMGGRCAGRSRPAPGVGERADNQRPYAAAKRPPRPSKFLSRSCSLPPLTQLRVSPGREGEGSLPAAPGAAAPFWAPPPSAQLTTRPPRPIGFRGISSRLRRCGIPRSYWTWPPRA
jgi:hypothetical protein